MAIPRRRVAAYLAAGLASDRANRLKVVAAWLKTKRSSELPLLVKDVESVLAASGYVTATATTATAPSPQLLQQIKDYITQATGATTVELSSVISPGVVGGVRLTLPDQELDTTVAHKLQSFVTELS